MGVGKEWLLVALLTLFLLVNGEENMHHQVRKGLNPISLQMAKKQLCATKNQFCKNRV